MNKFYHFIIFFLLSLLLSCELRIKEEKSKKEKKKVTISKEEIKIIEAFVDSLVVEYFTPPLPSKDVNVVDEEIDMAIYFKLLPSSFADLSDNNYAILEERGIKGYKKLFLDFVESNSEEFDISSKFFSFSEKYHLVNSPEDEVVFVKLSRVTLNKSFNKAILYYEYLHLGISFGKLVLLEKRNNIWKINKTLTLWME